jgi:hypothetical protein
MTSRLIVNSIRHTGGSADAVTLASDGTCTANITNNLSNRNLIINGAMQVAQRATSVTGITSGNYYVCDRWILGYGTAGTWTLSQSTDTPNDFGNSFKFDCTTANGSLSAGSNLQLKQFFEGQNLQQIQKGTSTAKEVTVSFYVKTNKTGTYVVELMDHDNSNRHCNKSYTVSDTNWNRYELTFPADTTGTLNNDNAKSFEVGFWLVAGSTFTGGSLQTTWSTLNQGSRAVGQINLADNTSNEWFITGVQLEVSDHATDFEHRSFGQELALCQRYFYKTYRQGVAPGTDDTTDLISKRNEMSASRTDMVLNIAYSVPMRATPTIVGYSKAGNSNKFLITGIDYSGGSEGTFAGTVYRGRKYLNQLSAGTTVPSGSYAHFHFTADAEL